MAEKNVVLTVRELNILKAIIDGHTYGEIASRLNIALRTVQWHACNIEVKLGARTMTSAACKAVALGLLGAVPSIDGTATIDREEPQSHTRSWGGK